MKKFCIHTSIQQNYYGTYCLRCREYVEPGFLGIYVIRTEKVMVDDIVYRIPYRVWIMLTEQDAKIKKLEDDNLQTFAKKLRIPTR